MQLHKAATGRTSSVHEQTQSAYMLCFVRHPNRKLATLRVTCFNETSCQGVHVFLAQAEKCMNDKRGSGANGSVRANIDMSPKRISAPQIYENKQA
jgi:hypothetical protein